MKKTKILMPLLSVAAFTGVAAPIATLASCAKKEDTKYTVTFFNILAEDTNVVEVIKDKTVAEPEKPTFEGFKFLGWFIDKSCNKAFDFSAKITKNLVLYAGWEILDVESISFASLPTKTNYLQGEKLDLTGLSINAILKDKTVVNLPLGTFETNPADGTVLDKIGKQVVTITIGEKKLELEIEVKPAVKNLIVTTDYSFTDVVVGQTISRSDFLVEAEWTDGNKTEVKDWTSNIFPEGTDTYKFVDKGEETIRIEFGGKQWTTKAIVDYSGEYEFNMPAEITLPMISTGDNAFTSQKQITILDNGVRVNSADFIYEIKQGADVIDVDEEGVITTKKVGTGAEIIVKKGDTAISNHIKVSVVQANDDIVSFPLISSHANYSCFAKDTKNICVIPDYIIHNERYYDINLIPSSDMDSVNSLYLPHNLYYVESNEHVGGTTLQHVNFDGTKEEYNNIMSEAWKWTSEFITGIQCIDGMNYIDNSKTSADLNIIEYASRAKVGFITPEFTEQVSNTTLQFDFGKLGELAYDDNGALRPLYTGIKFNNYTSGAQDMEVYADGQKLEKDTDWTFNSMTNVFNFTSGEKWNAQKGKNIIIKAPGIFKVNGCAGMMLNTPTKINFVSARQQWNVGDKFSIRSLKANYELAGGLKYEIPNKYLACDLVGHEFTEAEIGKKTVTFSDTIFGLEGTYEITINE